MYDMAESYNNSGSSLYHSTTVATDVSNAFNYWISVDPQSTNWFDNAIRTPQDLGTTMVLMRNVLTSSQISSGNTILNRANAELSDPSIAVGTNLVNLALAGIYQGIVNQNSSMITQGFSEIDSTTAPVSPALQQDGIMPDHTYHFHGSQLYEGDYGTSILSEVLDYGTLAVGTQYALTTAQEQTLNWIRCWMATQWFIYGQALDFTASGERDPLPPGIWNAWHQLRQHHRLCAEPQLVSLGGVAGVSQSPKQFDFHGPGQFQPVADGQSRLF